VTERPRLIVRAAAFLALVALAAAILLALTGAIKNLSSVVLTAVALSTAVIGGWNIVSRTGAARLVAIGVVVAALALLGVAIAIGDVVVPRFVATVALAGLAEVAAAYALHQAATPSAPAPPPATRPTHPVLVMNPKSGGGKVERFGLVDECRARGIEPVVLAQGDDLRALAEDAIARGADVIGMAGGDGSQALVSSVASRHGIPHVVIPAGTRNHFALDLGIDRDDVVGALDAFADGVDTRIDLAEVNGRVFVNNASLGVYARIVQSSDYRDAKVQTTLAALPDLLSGSTTLDLRFTDPDGLEVPTAQVIQVSNDPYELRHAQGRGTRARLDRGVLGIVTVQIDDAASAERFVRFQATGRLDAFPGWREWTAPTFEVRSDGPVEIGVDGEALVMDPPLVFTSHARALTIRLPRSAGVSPAAKAVRLSSRSTLMRLARLTAGRAA
jgi:diacylglycerol kinase family enzyme